jgi:hypothetical protein
MALVPFDGSLQLKDEPHWDLLRVMELTKANTFGAVTNTVTRIIMFLPKYMDMITGGLSFISSIRCES